LGVARIGRRAGAEQQLRRSSSCTKAAASRLFAAGDRAQQRVGEFAADRGADLRDLLDRREPVETRRQ
jgi:hypothetical protein